MKGDIVQKVTVSRSFEISFHLPYEFLLGVCCLGDKLIPPCAWQSLPSDFVKSHFEHFWKHSPCQVAF